MAEKVQGNLIIIGGAEDKNGKKEILKKVAEFIDKENEANFNSHHSYRVSRKKL